jgi:hypothetical protein
MIIAGFVGRVSAIIATGIRMTNLALWRVGTIVMPSMPNGRMASTSGFVEHALSEFRRHSVGPCRRREGWLVDETANIAIAHAADPKMFHDAASYHRDTPLGSVGRCKKFERLAMRNWPIVPET